MSIKFEIALEPRIAFDTPGPQDAIAGIAALTPLDLAAGKLLALADRWRDDGLFSRDLIDLAMMRPAKPLLRAAIVKAATAYGDGVEASLANAVQDVRERPHRLDACMGAMQMTTLSKAQLCAHQGAGKALSFAIRQSPPSASRSTAPCACACGKGIGHVTQVSALAGKPQVAPLLGEIVHWPTRATRCGP